MSVGVEEVSTSTKQVIIDEFIIKMVHEVPDTQCKDNSKTQTTNKRIKKRRRMRKKMQEVFSLLYKDR